MTDNISKEEKIQLLIKKWNLEPLYPFDIWTKLYGGRKALLYYIKKENTNRIKELEASIALLEAEATHQLNKY